MQPALVLGSTHATVKHASFIGRRLVVVQPVGVDDITDGAPLLALDDLGSRQGDRVIISSDAKFAQEMTDSQTTPARWSVIGIEDQ